MIPSVRSTGALAIAAVVGVGVAGVASGSASHSPCLVSDAAVINLARRRRWQAALEPQH